MIKKEWVDRKTVYCDRAGCQVALQVELAVPPEHLPEQLPRILARRCSHGLECNLIEKASCIWSGTNPDYDLFKETSSVQDCA